MKKIKIEAAEFTSSDATPELIKELVADDSKRGEFMILDDGKDFVQIAGGPLWPKVRPAAHRRR